MSDDKAAMPLDKRAWATSLLLQQVMLVSSADAAGVPGIAPKSWVSMVAFSGPMLGFGCNITHRTFQNIRDTGDFVVNVPPAGLADTIWQMAEYCGAERIDRSGLTLRPASTVAAPLVAECVGHLECREAGFRQWGDEVYVFGTVLHVAIDPACLAGSPETRYRRVDPIFYLEEKTYGTLGRVRPVAPISRPPTPE